MTSDSADADLLDELLDGGAAADLPQRLLQLATVAAELAGALASPALSRAERERILARAQGLSHRRGWLRGAVSRPHRPSRPITLVAAGAGGAAVTLALIGVALVRRSTHPPALPAAVRPAA